MRKRSRSLSSWINVSRYCLAATIVSVCVAVYVNVNLSSNLETTIYYKL